MDWVYLLIAGICEWGWPLGLKLGWGEKGVRYGWLAFSALSMVGSGGLLLAALKTIPMGTAYAVWTGIGAVGTFMTRHPGLQRTDNDQPVFLCRADCRRYRRVEICPGLLVSYFFFSGILRPPRA